MPASKINGAAIDQAVISDGCIIDRSRISQSLDRGAMPDGTRLPGTPVSADGGRFLRDRGVQAGECREGNSRVGVGENTRIESAIIDKKRPDRGQLRDLAGGQTGAFYGENYFIREGIAIVPKGAVIPDGTIV